MYSYQFANSPTPLNQRDKTQASDHITITPTNRFLRLKKCAPAISIFMLALVVRIIYNLTNAHNYVPTYDAGLYHQIAINLVEKRCFCIHENYATVSRAPLWPWILSVVYALTGEHDINGRFFYCFLGSGTCVILYLLAMNLFGKGVAFIAGMIAACYTGIFLYDGWLYTESLYTFFLLGFTYALYRLQRQIMHVNENLTKKRPQLLPFFLNQRLAVVTGLFLAAVTLVRPNGVLLIGVLGVWAAVVIMINKQRWRTVCIQLLIILVIGAMCVLPWTYRNYIVSHAFVLVSTGSGEVLNGAYNNGVISQPPDHRGFWNPPPGSRIHDDVGYTPTDDKNDAQQALYWMVSHPTEVFSLWGLHLINMWKPYNYAHGLPMEQHPGMLSSKILTCLLYYQSPLIFLLAVCGFITTWRRYRGDLLTVYLVVGLTIFQNVAFYANIRFRSPIEPLLVMLASVALCKFIGFISKSCKNKYCWINARKTTNLLSRI